MGLERASQRKKPQRNVVLTIEQKAGAESVVGCKTIHDLR